MTPLQEVYFKDFKYEKLFFIFLVDFLSGTDGNGPIESTFLTGLSDICKQPQFSANNSASELQMTVQNFQNWLNNEIETEIWLPGNEGTINISISRLNAIKMSEILQSIIT